MKIFVKAEVDVTLKDENGCTVLHYLKEPNVIEYLMNLADFTESKNEYGENPLHHAVRFLGSNDTIHALLTGGIDVESLDDEGRTVLQLAMLYYKIADIWERKDRKRIVEFLLTRGANLLATGGINSLDVMKDEEDQRSALDMVENEEDRHKFISLFCIKTRDDFQQ